MFSETVDRVIERSKRPDRLLDAADYVNAILRQLHSEHFFRDDSRELRMQPATGLGQAAPAQFFAAPPPTFGGWVQPVPFVQGPAPGDNLALTGSVHVWPHPRELRKLDAVRYDGHCYAQYRRPSRQQNEFCEYYYVVGGHHVFVGWKSFIDVYYFVYPPHFKYYTADQRPAVFDRAVGSFMYRSPAPPVQYVTSLGNGAVEAALQFQVYDWMLDRWQDLVIEGALAKLYANLDDQRANNTQALYNTEKLRMISAEVEYAGAVG